MTFNLQSHTSSQADSIGIDCFEQKHFEEYGCEGTGTSQHMDRVSGLLGDWGSDSEVGVGAGSQ